MPLSAGTRLGPYEIVAAIGAGGMGEVYRARDTRLERTVAIKVLPAHTADRPEVRQRFDREARAVSALNHPNICTLYDIGQQDEIDFLVMEYLEGETLADRLQKGTIPLEQALRIAIQVADGLDRAHRTGITHRDLKPGNIMLTKDGAKILDFGLAKIRDRAEGAVTSGGSVLATLTSPLTGEGAIVGTLQYMSPEQLEGQEADARSDIFAFGSIVYEMVAGRRPFEGKTQAALIAKILEHDPPSVSSIHPAVPPALEPLLQSCLAKDPAERRQSMHDVLLDLRWIAHGGSHAPVAPPAAPGRPKSARPWMAATAVLALATATVLVLYWLRPQPEAQLMRFAIPPPEKATFGYGLAISPDGRRLVYAARAADAPNNVLWVRTLDSLSALPIPGTEDAQFPFWSPDSRFIGFFAERKLKKVDVTGGPVQVLGDAPDARGGTWSQNGTILFAPNINLPLQRISAGGSTPAAATRIDATRKEIGHRWPYFLPDGRHYFCYSYCGSAESAIALGSLDGQELKILMRADSGPAFGPPGFLLYVKSNVLMAQPFNSARLRLEGDPSPVVQNVAAEGEAGPTAFARFSVSRNGLMAYLTGTGTSGQFAWYDRQGNSLGTIADPGSVEEPAFSPDQTRFLYTWFDSPVGPTVWLYDLARNVKSRFSSGAGVDGTAVWSPDGSKVVFISRRGNLTDLYQKAATGTGPEELLFSSKFDKSPNDWSPDGRTLIFETSSDKVKEEVWTLSLADRKASPYLQSESNNGRAALSPDGHWVAYASDETGRTEVYVQSFPVPGNKSAISPAGGDQPSWRRDGKELFYLAPDGKLMSVPVTTGAAFAAQAPHALFQTHTDPPAPLTSAPLRNSYVPTANGQKFLIYTLTAAVSSSPITLVTNWSAGLGR